MTSSYFNLFCGFLVLIMINACSQHPQDGDIYENKLTQLRVEVDVGQCYKLASTQQMWNDIEKRARDSMVEEGYEYYNVFTSDGKAAIVSVQFRDSTQTCVGYKVEERMKGIGIVKSYKLVPKYEFKQDFSLVE